MAAAEVRGRRPCGAGAASILRGLFLSRLGFAGNQERERPGVARDVGRLQLGLGVGDLIRHHAVIEEIAQRAGLDGEVDVLGNVAGRRTNLIAFSFAATTPTTSPLAANSGPPLLPG